ncbi:hypothetical protein [Escherichia phage TR1]|nr:hypothetical protein [Escherichia phage TR1]
MMKVKCLNNLNDGTWEFRNGKHYIYDEMYGYVVGDNFKPVYCYIDDERVIAAIKNRLIFETVEG